MKAREVLVEYCAALSRRIDEARKKADLETTRPRDAHDLHTYVGGLEEALELARAFLVEVK